MNHLSFRSQEKIIVDLIVFGVLIISLCYSGSLRSQARIDYSAVTNGIILPISDTNSVTNLSPGIMVYDNLDSMLYVYDGVRFKEIGFEGELSSLSDNDNDTMIEVEKNSDEDIIRFSVEGTDRFRMIGDRFEIGTLSGNLFFGKEAGESHMSGVANTMVGVRAGSKFISAFDNTFIGSNAGRDHEEGNGNTALGSGAMIFDSSGMRNTAIGHSSLSNCKSCTYTNSVGFNSLKNLKSGSDNLAFGSSTYQNKTEGTDNIGIGNSAGFNNISGSGNILIGSVAGYNETGSDKLYIDGSSNGSATPLIYGEFDTDLIRVNGDFQVYGKTVFNPDSTSRDIILDYRMGVLGPEPIIYPTEGNWGYLGDENLYFYQVYSNEFFATDVANYKTFSDKRLKKDIKKLSDGMQIVSKLKPVSYSLIQKDSKRKEISNNVKYGLIAQEVEEVLPNIVQTHSSGMKSVGYQAIIPFLIKGLQEQEERIVTLRLENNNYKNRLKKVEEQLENLSAGKEKTIK